MGKRRTASAAVGLSILAVSAGTLAPASAAAVAAGAAAEARNPQIAGLQVALRAYGLYQGRVDAIPGPATVAATKAFQQQVGIPATGRPDARTRVALGPVGGPLFGRRALELRAFGWDVAVLQFLLAENHLSSGPIDGWFDRTTLLGVRRFQRNASLEPDGIVGKATLAALARQWQVPLAHVPGSRPPSSHPPPATPQEAPPTPIRRLLDHWSQRSGVDPHLVRALAWVESGFQPRVVSPAGALGVMQVMPSTWRWVEDGVLHRRVPKTASGNILVGVTYLRRLLDDFHGDRPLAVAAWLQGPASVRRDGVLAATLPFVNAVLDLSRRV